MVESSDAQIKALRAPGTKSSPCGAAPKGFAPLPSPTQLLWLCLALGAAVLITFSPAMVQQQGLAAKLGRAPSPDIPCPTAPTPRHLELPWESLLTPAEQRRGISYFGSGQRLQGLAQKLLAGRPIKAFSLGGSVTSGGGSSINNETAYVPRFHRFIHHNFPHKDHVLENKAIAASTAFLYTACLQHHVPEDADLVTIEFTVNEAGDLPYQTWERRSYEQLIRRLLARPHPTAVLVLHHYGWWNSAGDGVDRGLFYPQPELQLTAFSHYYDVPTLSLRSAAWHLMNAGVDRFKVDKVTMAQRMHNFLQPDGSLEVATIPRASKELKPLAFYADHVHPADPGHQVLAELLAGALGRAVWDATSGAALTAAEVRHDPSVPSMPPPMIPGSSDDVPGMCAMLEEFKAVVGQQSGFEYMPERPQAEDFVKQKWGWRATEPGSWAELEVDTRAAAGRSNSSSSSGSRASRAADTVVWLSHLKSYEGMGTARIECVSGCRCNPTRLDGTWQRRVSLFTITRFHVSRHRHCRLRVTVLDAAGEVPQEGHKVVLVAVMVTHVPLKIGGIQGTLGNVQNIGLSLDKGF